MDDYFNTEEWKESANTTNSSFTPDVIEINKIRQILKQYSDSHLKELDAQKAVLAERYITAYKMDMMNRGQLAQMLVSCGFTQLEVIEIMEQRQL